jgi:hypothetical protein
MANIKNISKASKIKEDLVSLATGEIYDQETTALIQLTDTFEVKLSYDSYIIVDDEALNHLFQQGVPHVEIALLFALSTNLEIGTGVCRDQNDVPYTTKTLAERVLKQSVQAARKKLKSLEQLGLLYYGKVPASKKKAKVYIVNPHLIRRGTKYSNVIPSLFNPVII